MSAREDEWLEGWDPTPGIVALWAEGDGLVTVWRRVGGALVREAQRFRPWVLCEHTDAELGGRELAGPGALRFVVRGDTSAGLAAAVLACARRRLGRPVGHLRELGGAVLALPPEEQYLVASGRTCFRGLVFDDLRRMQLELIATGPDPTTARIAMIAVREPTGAVTVLDDVAEAALIAGLVAAVQAADPDVLEGHELHGVALPFLERRAHLLGVPLALGRIGPPGLRTRAAARGVVRGAGATRPVRFVIPGRDAIDTLDAVRRHDFTTCELPGHGLAEVAQHLGLTAPGRDPIARDRLAEALVRDPARVRRHAIAAVEEVAGLARLMSGSAFALAQMVPRRYERLADAGAATGVVDPLLVRAYLRANAALPAHQAGDGTPHSGAALHLFATGVATRVVKADVASLYPSLMRSFRIGPARDHLGAFLALVDRLVDRRLAAKAAGRRAAAGSAERHAHEALSAAMKLIVNSAYGYLAAGGLTRFADVHAANEVTRRGRAALELMCRELAARGVTLLEADTDGVYFAVPASWREADERAVVDAVAALLPPRVQLELEGRYAAMLSHEPKNYALLTYDGEVVLRGVAFRSSRAEPFGEAFLRRALACLLGGDVAGVRAAYLATVDALRERALPTASVAARVRLARTPAQYAATRDTRRELIYEALLASGRAQWAAGDTVRVYRTARGGGGVIDERADDPAAAPRDYDVEHYVRVLHDGFATRLVRALTPEDYAAVFADPDQLPLFARPLAAMRSILTTGLGVQATADDGDDVDPGLAEDAAEV